MSRSADVRYTFTPSSSTTSFEVVSFSLDEALSADGLLSADGAPLPFRLSVELSAFDDNVDFSRLLDAPAHFAIWRDEQVVRHVWGIVTAWEQRDSGTHRTRYSAVIEPALARLTLRSNCRIFQQLNVPDIINTLLKEHGLLDVEWHLAGAHLPREFASQWNESDWAFVQRIAADEGIFVSIAHDAHQHRLIFTDTVQSLPSGGTLIYQPQAGGMADQPSLRRFRYREQVAPTRTVGRDYTFHNARYNLEHHAVPYASDARLGQPASDTESTGEYAFIRPSTMGASRDTYERFRYPADYKRDEVGKPFTRTRLHAERRDAAQAHGEGDAAFLMPGVSYTLEGHPREAWNRDWRVVRLHHEGTQHPSQGEDATEGATTYSNTVVFVPREFEWKAPLWAKPRVDGPLIATVVGPANEEVWVDKWGRVKLQFPWDREGKSDDASSCWIRVAKGWAGVAWGMQALPRVGHEAVVIMLGGDIDQPMVVASAHHPGNPPPYELPKFHAIHTVKSKELKGNRANELRIDDTSQQISAALMSDHGATALHLGYLTHPRPQGGAPRGEGFELRTDEHGALRAAKGLLVSAYAQAQAGGRQLDIAELLQLVDQLAQQAKDLLDVAQRQQALPAEHASRDQLVQAIHALGAGANDRQNDAGGKPIVITGAPAGLVTATPASMLHTAGGNIESIARQDQSLMASRCVHITAGNGISAFAVDGGIRHLANQGDMITQAQRGNVTVQANENIHHQANKQCLTEANDKMIFKCGRSAIVLNPDGRIELFGTEVIPHAKWIVEDSSSLSTAVQQWDNTPFNDRFQAHFPDGSPAAHQHYELVRSDGTRIPGITDAAGWLTLQQGLNPEGLGIVWLGAAATERTGASSLDIDDARMAKAAYGDPSQWTAQVGSASVDVHSSPILDIDKAVNQLDSAANDQSTRRCAQYVRQALNAGGLKLSSYPAQAKAYGPTLLSNGFGTVEKNGYVPQKGDIAVIQDYPGGSPEGHITMYDGTQWVSDFKQRDMWSGPGYRSHQPSYEIYRYEDQP
ncbi:type VI secretion system secreted protein VgrG [Dyella jiangningensis]|nr:type VI secretion system secreted protein VgrG [Dyella jiangningensis]